MDSIISINICVDNAAFGVTYDDQAAEVARILRDAANRMERGPGELDEGFPLRDFNGNTVGTVVRLKE